MKSFFRSGVLLTLLGCFVASMWLSAEALDMSSWNPMRLIHKQEAPTDAAPPAKPKATSDSPATPRFLPKSESKADLQAAAFVAADLLPHQGVLLETQDGNIVIQLYPQDAPRTVANFTKLVKSGFYNNNPMSFHRVVPGFVVQTGDPTGTGYGGSRDRIPLEVDNKLTHKEKGIVAMARGPDPDSATSQFYITLAPQRSLDGKYAIFGEVIKGRDVLDKIQKGHQLYKVSLIDLRSIQPDEDLTGKKSGLKSLFKGG